MKLYNFLQRAHTTLKYVPHCEPFHPRDIEKLQNFISDAHRILIITGAGISTESGIPDYRSEGVGTFARTSTRPIYHAEFLRSERIRQQYWARNFVGWPYFDSTQPNDTHITLSEWEKSDKFHWLVTQNIDRLHQKAGNKRITALHGSFINVVCLSCKSVIDRNSFQHVLRHCNPDWIADTAEIAADADVILTPEQVKDFHVPTCEKCSGILKPAVTFFGDNVAKDVVDFVFNQVNDCDSVLVLGSSLSVYSGYRFIERAAKLKKNIALVNIGVTRADHLSHLKVGARCAQVLPLLKFS